MEKPPGQETGHASVGHVADAFTWREYVHALRDELGGWADLARAIEGHLQEQAPEGPDSVIKGLKRLARRRHQPGGRYGDLLLRVFGLPPSIKVWGRLMGQYHSRFADLPVGLRREQLLRWDRPPVSDSPAAAWVHLGLASLAHRDRDLDEAKRRLSLAADVRKPEAAAQLEHALLTARIASDERRHDVEAEAVLRAESLLAHDGLTRTDRLCFQARIADQRAYRVSRNWRSDSSMLAKALALYEAIPSEDVPPFVAFRREIGIAWCLWRQGDPVTAMDRARRAHDHAGDGGFVRLRVMALNLMAGIANEGADGPLRARAGALAEALEDVELRARLRPHHRGSVAPSTP
jgi:hypothetical protein